MNRINPMKLLLVFLLYISIGVNAQTVDTSKIISLSLKEAREYALKHNYDIRNSEKNIHIAERQMKEIIAEGLPQVSASGTLTDNLQIQQQIIDQGGVPTPIRFGTQYNLGLTGKVNQLLFNGSYIVGVQTAKIYRRLAKVQHESTELDVVGTVSESYYNVLIGQQSRAILDKSLKNLQVTLNEAQARYKEGFIEITDVDQLQISVNKVSTSLKSLDNQINIAEQLLKFQLGMSFDTPIVLLDNLESIVNDASKKVITKQTFNLSENKSYQLANLQIKMGEKNVANQKMAFLPSLSAFGQIGRTTMRDEFQFKGSTWFPSSAIGLSLDVPIFSGGARYQKVKQAQLELEQYKIQEEQLNNSLKIQNSVAESNLQTSYMNYLDDEKNMALSLKVYQRMRTKYEEGVASNMDLIQSYDQFLNTQNTYISRCSDLMKSYNEYEKLITNFNLK